VFRVLDKTNVRLFLALLFPVLTPLRDVAKAVIRTTQKNPKKKLAAGSSMCLFDSLGIDVMLRPCEVLGIEWQLAATGPSNRGQPIS
jgi:hypothetical protein